MDSLYSRILNKSNYSDLEELNTLCGAFSAKVACKVGGRQQGDFLVKRQQRDDIVDTLVIAQAKIMEGIISVGRSNRN